MVFLYDSDAWSASRTEERRKWEGEYANMRNLLDRIRCDNWRVVWFRPCFLDGAVTNMPMDRVVSSRVLFSRPSFDSPFDEAFNDVFRYFMLAICIPHYSEYSYFVLSICERWRREERKEGGEGGERVFESGGERKGISECFRAVGIVWVYLHLATVRWGIPWS